MKRTRSQRIKKNLDVLQEFIDAEDPEVLLLKLVPPSRREEVYELYAQLLNRDSVGIGGAMNSQFPKCLERAKEDLLEQLNLIDYLERCLESELKKYKKQQAAQNSKGFHLTMGDTINSEYSESIIVGNRDTQIYKMTEPVIITPPPSAPPFTPIRSESEEEKEYPPTPGREEDSLPVVPSLDLTSLRIQKLEFELVELKGILSEINHKYQPEPSEKEKIRF